MSYKLTLDQIPFHAITKAAEFVREKYNMDRGTIMTEEFENEFNLKLHSANYILSFQYDIEFQSETDYLLFLLKWL